MLDLQRETPGREFKMPRQANREGDFSFEIIRHLGVYGHSAEGWTREANIVEWNGGNAKFDLREWDPEHTRMSRGITLQKQEMFNLMQILNHCFGKELQAHRNAREQWMPQDGTQKPVACSCGSADCTPLCDADGVLADDADIADDKDAADGKRGADDFGFADDAAQDAEETAAEIFSSETLTDVQEETVLG